MNNLIFLLSTLIVKMKTKLEDINFFPWDLYFSQNELELNNAKETCTNYSINILFNALKAASIDTEVPTFYSKKSKKELCTKIIGVVKNITSELNKIQDSKEREIQYIKIKKEIKQRFFTFLGIEQVISSPKLQSPSSFISQKDKEDNEEGDEVEILRISIEIFNTILKDSDYKVPSLREFKKSIKTNLSSETVTEIFNTIKQVYTKGSKNKSKEEIRKFILEQIAELKDEKTEDEIKEEIQIVDNSKTDKEKQKDTKVIEMYMKNKGWQSNKLEDISLSEYLMDKMLEEEKEFKKNEIKIEQELERYNLLLAQVQSDLAEQIQLVKQLKTIKKVKNKVELAEAENELQRLKTEAEEIKMKMNEFEKLNKHIEDSRKDRRKICHQLDYDEDIIDQALIVEDLDCGDNQVCNINKNVCEDNSSTEGFSYPVEIGGKVIDLVPTEDAKELELKLKKTSYQSPPILTSSEVPRFVSINSAENDEVKSDEVKNEEEEEDSIEEQLKKLSSSRSLSKEEDSGLECFKKEDYDTIDDLKEDLNCDDQICDINTNRCVDRFEDQTIGKVQDAEYTYTDNTNVDLMNKLKQKFKNVVMTPVSSIAQKMQPVVDIDVPIIDMDVPPAHLSEKVNLQSFTNLMQNVQSKARLSIDQRFDNRTKARRDMIRKCLQLNEDNKVEEGRQ